MFLYRSLLLNAAILNDACNLFIYRQLYHWQKLLEKAMFQVHTYVRLCLNQAALHGYSEVVLPCFPACGQKFWL